MPIIRSAKKALRQSKKRGAENKIIKKELKKTLKIVRQTAGAKEPEKAKSLIPAAYKKIDKAAKRGLIHRNTAARKKSRLSRAVNKVF